MFIDSHAHVNFGELLSDIDSVLERAKQAGVEKIVNIGTSLADSKTAIEIAEKYEWLFATVGIHPIDNLQASAENVDWKQFEHLVEHSKVVAIGECGLDYSKLSINEGSIYSDAKDRQGRLFEKQIEIAKKFDRPLSIHIRNAQDDIMERFSDTLSFCRGVFHCFSGNEKYVKFILEKLPNFYISFAGNVTFRNGVDLLDLAKSVPLNRLLVETDCPFLAPEPVRGSRNEPANVKITAQKLAAIKNVDLEEIAQNTTINATSLFKL